MLILVGVPVRFRGADPRRARRVPGAVVADAAHPRSAVGRRGRLPVHLRDSRRGLALHAGLEGLRAEELELNTRLLGADCPTRRLEQARRDAVRVFNAAEPELLHERLGLLRVEDHG